MCNHGSGGAVGGGGGRGGGGGWGGGGGGFFFNDTATTEIYTLSLHDALPILVAAAPPFLLTISRFGSAHSFYTAHFSLQQRPAFYTARFSLRQRPCILYCPFLVAAAPHFLYCPFLDRKSTRLNSSHTVISYAVFCLKKKKKKKQKQKKNWHKIHSDHYCL